MDKIHNRKIFGENSENLAVSYLTSNDYRVIQRNYYSQYGEIDIIAKKNEELIFCEVKGRSSSVETAMKSVSFSKQKKISKTASIFLSENPEYEDFIIRFDVIAVNFISKNGSSIIVHLKDAFDPILI